MYFKLFHSLYYNVIHLFIEPKGHQSSGIQLYQPGNAIILKCKSLLEPVWLKNSTIIARGNKIGGRVYEEDSGLYGCMGKKKKMKRHVMITTRLIVAGIKQKISTIFERIHIINFTAFWLFMWYSSTNFKDHLSILIV